ncbi:MAG: hypothetical protein LBQ21_07575 [Clostridiales Family XIII bacterium]|jgi:hypothetical protein|nr:hypothetical protein [Clostridiales Family XIII bacterium]
MSKEKIDTAIRRLTEEANKKDTKPFYRFSELLIDRCVTDEIADLLLADDKTIAGADKKIAEEARKDGGCIDDEAAHAILFEYFGLPASASPAGVINAFDLL